MMCQAGSLLLLIYLQTKPPFIDEIDSGCWGNDCIRAGGVNQSIFLLLQFGEEPAFLPVGTEVSAKYRGAFCEAKVKKIVRNVKCKVRNLQLAVT